MLALLCTIFLGGSFVASMEEESGGAAVGDESAREWSKLTVDEQLALDRKTCKKAAKLAPYLGSCPNCKENNKKPCQLKCDKTFSKTSNFLFFE